MSIRLFAAALLAACLATITASARAFVIENFAQGSFGDSGGFSTEFSSGAGPFGVTRGFLAFNLAGAPTASAASITFFPGQAFINDPTGEQLLALWAFRGNVGDLITGTGGIAPSTSSAAARRSAVRRSQDLSVSSSTFRSSPSP